MEPKCPICQHKDVNEINRDIVLRSMSVRNVGSKYNIPFNYVQKHKPHITKSLALAAERRDMNASDRLLQDTEMLWKETQDALALSKQAVKTMAVTEGHGKGAKTVHKEYQDVGALLSAIKVAHENRRLFGDATGAIKSSNSTTQIGVYLSIAMPRMDATPASVESPIIETTVLNTVEDNPEADPDAIPEYPDYDGEPFSQPHTSTILGKEARGPLRGPQSTIPRAEPEPPVEAKVYPAWEPRKPGRPSTGGRKKSPKEYLEETRKLKASVKEKIWGPRPPKE